MLPRRRQSVPHPPLHMHPLTKQSDERKGGEETKSDLTRGAEGEKSAALMAP